MRPPDPPDAFIPLPAPPRSAPPPAPSGPGQEFQKRAARLLRFVHKGAARFLTAAYEPADTAHVARFMGA